MREGRYELTTRQEINQFIEKEVLTTSEAMELLGVTRSRMSQLIKSGELVPVKKMKGNSLFFRGDVEEKLEELQPLREKYRPYDSQ